MTEKTLNGLRVAIICTDWFEQAEMTEPRQALDEAGAETMLIAPKNGKVQGVKHDKRADEFPVDLALDQADPEQFDAVLLPGGAMNVDAIRMEPKAQDFVRAMDRADKPIAVICHGPWLLISAGLTRGRTLTSYHTMQDDVKNSGAHWVDRQVVRDGNWVSSRQPDDIPAFNREMIALFAEDQQRKAA